MRMLPISAAGLLMLTAACATPTTPEATETEAALCEAWRDSLPTRSRSDTDQTQAEIGRAYDVLEAVCGLGIE